MIPSRSRLPRTEFSSRAYGTVKTPYFSLKAKENPKRTMRIGVIVGKAVHKTAAERNFLKRQAKAILTSARAKKDIMVIIAPAARSLTKSEFKKELLKVMQRI